MNKREKLSSNVLRALLSQHKVNMETLGTKWLKMVAASLYFASLKEQRVFVETWFNAFRLMPHSLEKLGLTDENSQTKFTKEVAQNNTGAISLYKDLQRLGTN